MSEPKVPSAAARDLLEEFGKRLDAELERLEELRPAIVADLPQDRAQALWEQEVEKVLCELTAELHRRLDEITVEGEA